MVVQEMTAGQHYEVTFEHVLQNDERVQQEYDQLNDFLAKLSSSPIDESPTESDPAWRIDDLEVSRWKITLQGNVRFDRVAQFREKLQHRDDVIDARVDSIDQGMITIRLVTTGGIPMGPLDNAVWELTRAGT